MSKKEPIPYLPDEAIVPGEVLDEHIESIGMTQAELAERTGLTPKTINEIVNGKAPVTPETAVKFERVLGRPAHYWNNLEQQYQEDLVRLADARRLQTRLEWLKSIPVRKMINLGWIREYKDKTRQMEEVLCFFGIAMPEQWESVFNGYQVAYRRSERFEKSDVAISAWLRRGDIEAQAIACGAFDKTRFKNVLGEVRALTTVEPRIFLPRLVDLCASAGVAVVFVPELPGTRVYGATRWTGGKAVIQLSLRYKSNDHLWFTFFHEAGHILLHGRKDVFIEGGDTDGVKEAEANRLAEDMLLPCADYAEFLATRHFTAEEITSFAAEVGIAPGIVVGRLQHDGLLPRNQGNRMKVFYTWAGI